MMNSHDREELRHAVLEALADRHAVALPLRAVRRAIEREVTGRPTDADLEATLEFLRSLGCLQVHPDPLGSTRYYQATAHGVLTIERRQWPPGREVKSEE